MLLVKEYMLKFRCRFLKSFFMNEEPENSSTVEPCLELEGILKDKKSGDVCASFCTLDWPSFKRRDEAEPVIIDAKELKLARQYLVSITATDPEYCRHQIGQIDFALNTIKVVRWRHSSELMEKFGLYPHQRRYSAPQACTEPDWQGLVSLMKKLGLNVVERPSGPLQAVAKPHEL